MNWRASPLTPVPDPTTLLDDPEPAAGLPADVGTALVWTPPAVIDHVIESIVWTLVWTPLQVSDLVWSHPAAAGGVPGEAVARP